MLHLVNAHRHYVRLIEKDIRRHQHGIGEEPCIDIVCMSGRLVLELRHAVQLSHIGKAVQNPCQLRMAGYMRLIVEAVFLRIDPCRDVNHQKVAGTLPEDCRILTHCDGMHVHYAVKAFILIAQVHPVFQSPKVISQCQITGGLHAAEQHFLSIYHTF